MGLLNFKIYKFIFYLLIYNYLNAEEYIISYKSVVKSGEIVFEDFNFAKSMRAVGTSGNNIIGFIELEANRSLKDKQIFINNRDEIIESLSKFGVLLKDHTSASRLIGSSQTTYIVPPTRVSLERDQFGAILIIFK